MHSDLPFPRFQSAADLWSGHQAALAARLGRPDAVRLTEEQEALALGISGRLITRMATMLPLVGQPAAIWAAWETGGVPSAGILAPVILARLEEYRWRRMVPAPIAEPTLALFGAGDGERGTIPLPRPAAAELVEHDSPAQVAVDMAYLALRIADAQRSDPFGMPELLPEELSMPVHRALLLDIAAQDLALAQDPAARAPQVAAAVEAALGATRLSGIDSAALSFARSIDTAEDSTGLLCAAVARHDWLAIVAVLAAKNQIGFSMMAASLVAADEAAIVAACAAINLPRSAVGPLLDALAEVPARPLFRSLPITDAADASMAQEMTLRAAALRNRGEGTHP